MSAPGGGDRLAGRTAVVVGSGQTPGPRIGNGRATAITFAAHGARLLLVDRDEARALDTATAAADAAAAAGHDLPEPVVVVTDIASAEGPERVVAAAVDRMGGFDILHNNVGIGAGDAPPHRLSDDDYDRILDVNLRAMWRTCRAAVPVLRAQERSAIVNVSSLASIAAGDDVLTAEFKVNFLRPATQPQFLARGRVIRAGRLLSVVEGDVLGFGHAGGQQDGIIRMQATMALLSREQPGD